MSMFELVQLYKMEGALKTCLQTDNRGSFVYWKRIIKNMVRENEVIRWEITCMLYKSLESISEVKMHCWWNFVRQYPQMSRKVSCVMSVLIGGQPCGMQRNFGATSCAVCHMTVRESAEHILFQCPALATQREVLWGKVLGCMPPALSDDIKKSNNQIKTQLVLSGLREAYIPEWWDIYESICGFVYGMYEDRMLKYDDLQTIIDSL